ncbi:MAG: Ig-like domain-containing protein [Planctomycetota bacterium]
MFARRLKTSSTITFLLIAFLPLISTAGCGLIMLAGLADLFCGTPNTTAPTVIFTSPANAATGVAINQKIAATFSEGMNPSSLDAAFTVTGPGASSVTGTVAYDVPSRIAIFTPAANLATNTAFTATLTTGASDLDGNGLASDFTWSFTTGATADTTAPTVVSTNPADTATGVPINKKVTATFSEAMDSSTISAASLTVVGPGATPVSGTVTYAAVGTTATFTPVSNLAANTAYTATITTAVRDLASNALASNTVWTFTTGATADTTVPTVVFTNPANVATDVPINKKINATFSEAMDPLTISIANYSVTGPGAMSITGTVSYDSASNIATFMPLTDLAPNTSYTARITTGVTDLTGNALASAFVWSFTTGTTLIQAPVDLRSLSTFAAVAGAGLTNSNSAGQTTINGDVGLSPTATCLGDGSPCSALNPLINGTLYANDPGGVAAAAKADLVLAYVDAAGRPPGTTVNDITGMVLAPGVYTSGSTMSIAVGGTLTLDAQGDANGVWIFQIGSSLTVNNSAQVLLINGAKASYVYWAIFASSTLGTNVSFKGNVLAGASNSLGTGSTVEGRLLCTTGQITLLSNTVTTPAP